VKNPRSGFQERVLMRRWDQPRPSLVEVACQVSMLRLAGSRRRSNQMAYRLPSGLESTQGKNWSLGAGAPAWVLRNLASVQWKPPSRDCCTEMSAPEAALLTLFW
jgi:hypothetical protein